MPPLFFVSPEGVPYIPTTKTPTTEVETKEEPLHVIAARQHAKDSTDKKDK